MHDPHTASVCQHASKPVRKCAYKADASWLLIQYIRPYVRKNIWTSNTAERWPTTVTYIIHY